jgi:glycerophosphoryl diester phosphodiesterase
MLPADGRVVAEAIYSRGLPLSGAVLVRRGTDDVLKFYCKGVPTGAWRVRVDETGEVRRLTDAGLDVPDRDPDPMREMAQATGCGG